MTCKYHAPEEGRTMTEDMIRTRLKQLEEEVQARSKHKNPMYYKALENYRWCSIVSDLLNGMTPDIKEVEAVCGVKSARTSTTQPSAIDLSDEIIEGANVMDIINRHRDIPNIHDILKQAIADEGYAVEGFYIIPQ